MAEREAFVFPPSVAASTSAFAASSKRKEASPTISPARAWTSARHGSPVLPLVLGADTRAMAVAATLQAAGFDVRGIRPPTVPEGTGRLRIALTLNVEVSDIVELCGALREALA